MADEIARERIGWGRFLLQFTTVIMAYVGMSIPAIIAFGETSWGYLLSVMGSMAGALLVAWAWLRRDGALGEAWNLARPDGWARALGIAAGATLAVMAIFMLGGPLLERLGFEPVDVDLVMQFITESPIMLVAWIFGVAWLAAGLGEELLWRGFLLDRLLRLPGVAGRLWLAIFIQAAMFGLPHLYQGWGGVLLTGLIGLLFGWLRIVGRWNLWPLVIAHAAVDTIMMLLGYADAQGWIEVD